MLPLAPAFPQSIRDNMLHVLTKEFPLLPDDRRQQIVRNATALMWPSINRKALETTMRMLAGSAVLKPDSPPELKKR